MFITDLKQQKVLTGESVSFTHYFSRNSNVGFTHFIHKDKNQVYLFLLQVYFVIGYIKGFIPISLSSQRFHPD